MMHGSFLVTTEIVLITVENNKLSIFFKKFWFQIVSTWEIIPRNKSPKRLRQLKEATAGL